MESQAIIDIPLFDPAAFHLRWSKARKAAIQKVLQTAGYWQDDFVTHEEAALLLLVPQADQGTVLKAVFDYSRALGLNVVRHFGLTWEVADIAQVLEQGSIGCFLGRFKNGIHAKVLERKGCNEGRTYGAFFCDYYREALDGLVMGVGETERFARHGSVGHGDEQCVDIIFNDAQYPDSQGIHFGTIPEKMQPDLNELAAELSKFKVSLTWKGLSEGVLYYTLTSASGPLCGTTGRLQHEALHRKVGARFPGLKLQDASPLAVYGEGT